jgi:hypothetical protein
MNPVELTAAYITALTGSPDTVCEWRVIHDTNKGEQGRNLRGNLSQLLPTLQEYNSSGWGVFMCINTLDGQGHLLSNVSAIRTHVADLDDPLNSHDGYNRAVASQLPPHIAVQSSLNKFHLYWFMQPYAGNDFYSEIQRKLAQLYNGDKQISDATRVLRVPGFYHMKNPAAPHLVTCWGLHNNARYTHEQISQHLAAVNAVAHFSTRTELGDPKLAAPSLEWLVFGLNTVDPNELSREEWMPLTAAFKQAGWTLADEQVLYKIWVEWCNRYEGNNEAENLKLWRSVRDTQVGWGRFERVTNVKAYINNNPAAPPTHQPQQAPIIQTSDPRTQLAEIIDTFGKQIWFKDCYFVARMGKIFSPAGRFMDANKFNGLYGGKEFTIRQAGGKTTDEPWKAALRSTDWTIPKVDHVRFLPSKKPYEIILDELGREGLNTYIPANVQMRQGDISIWFEFLNKILPTPEDVEIFNKYMAHNIKYPGHKIPWGVLIQSERGIGKQIIGMVAKYCLGESYTYEPDAEQLVSGASKFNGWMRNKLMIIVDEIRVGDRRDLLEGLKKVVTDKRVAVESKGIDQEMEDNLANWLFFSNYKDAIPINENERRYCVFYSQLQSARAIEVAGMNKDYFDRIFNWLDNGGYAHLAYWYKHFPIAQGELPNRAPKTSSYAEVIRIGRTPLEILLDDKIESGERGFRGGFVSWPMLLKAVQQSSMRYKPADYIVRGMLEGRGYVELGHTPNPVAGEDIMRPSLLFGQNTNLKVIDYEQAQR